MTDNATPWWGTAEKVSPRFIKEVGFMREKFGSRFTLHIPRPGSPGTLYWEGRVEVAMTELAPDRRPHTLHIVYPENYPNSAARACCVDPLIQYANHMLAPIGGEHGQAGTFCLFNPTEGVNHGWNPSRSTALTVTLWAIQWLYAYYTWTFNNLWPGDEHYVPGAREAVNRPEQRRISPEERLRALESRVLDSDTRRRR